MRVPVVPRTPGGASVPLVPKKSPPVDNTEYKVSYSAASGHIVHRDKKSNGHTQNLADWAGPPKAPSKHPKSRGPKSGAKNHSAARAAAQACIDAKSWRDAAPNAILGLYSLLHARVYGVIPAELDGPDYLPAVSRAKAVCKDLTPQGAYELVRWTWKRAEERERNRKEGSDDFRIGWRYQFSASMITNFKVARARAGKSL